MIILDYLWSGEAPKLSVEPGGRVENPEAKRPRRVSHTWYKTVIE